MALFAKGIEISKTIGGVTLYPLFGNTYVRRKSSLTRKRVKSGQAFEKTRKYASDLGRAAKIGSLVYRALPANIRERWLFRAITGEAASLIYKGKTDQEVHDLLYKKYIEDTKVKEEGEFGSKGHNGMPSSKETNIRVRERFLERWEKQGKPYFLFKQAWQKRGYFNWHRFREVLESITAFL